MRAIPRDLFMQGILGRLMAVLALPARVLLQQGMIEAPRLPEALHAGMIAMTGHAIIRRQTLMEGHRGQWLGDFQSRGGELADACWLVTGHATARISPGKGTVTGKAVGLQLLVSRNQFPRAYHQMRIYKG